MARAHWFLAALATAALIGCGPKAAPDAGSGATAASPADKHGGAWLKRYNEVLPDWLLIAHTATGGFVQYNRKDIKRDEAAGTTDVWLQILHREPQTFRAENDTVVRETLYNKDRFLYRFQCAQGKYTIVQHEIMGPNDIVIEKVDTPPAKASDWRTIAQGGPAEILAGPICRT